MKSILDSSFDYVPSASTDLAKTFARIRKEQKAADKARREAASKAAVKVSDATNVTYLTEIKK